MAGQSDDYENMELLHVVAQFCTKVLHGKGKQMHDPMARAS